jgi:hypothetical protein
MSKDLRSNLSDFEPSVLYTLICKWPLLFRSRENPVFDSFGDEDRELNVKYRPSLTGQLPDTSSSTFSAKLGPFSDSNGPSTTISTLPAQIDNSVPPHVGMSGRPSSMAAAAKIRAQSEACTRWLCETDTVLHEIEELASSSSSSQQTLDETAISA